MTIFLFRENMAKYTTVHSYLWKMKLHVWCPTHCPEYVSTTCEDIKLHRMMWEMQHADNVNIIKKGKPPHQTHTALSDTNPPIKPKPTSSDTKSPNRSRAITLSSLKHTSDSQVWLTESIWNSHQLGEHATAHNKPTPWDSRTSHKHGVQCEMKQVQDSETISIAALTSGRHSSGGVINAG